jgi:hypothetical protein
MLADVKKALPPARLGVSSGHWCSSAVRFAIFSHPSGVSPV